MSFGARRGSLLFSALLLLASTPHVHTSQAFFQKGVNFTSESPDGYVPENAVPMLNKLKAYGVNSIALVPYGFNRLGTTKIHFSGAGGGGWERDEYLVGIAAEAHRLGMHVLLKPQIWTGRGYPGDITFASPDDAKKWFAEYRPFVEHYSKLASQMHADLFCIGTEFGKLVKYESEWRSLIARARQLYRGPLVYAANSGPEFETLKFWDALDFIGLNEYYPLPDDLSTHDVVQRVESIVRRYKKPVIFTEAGFSTYQAPQRAPWDDTPGTLAPRAQAQCYDAVFKAFWDKPWFAGVYWWKVGTNGYGGPSDGSHTPWGKPAMDVIAKWYKRR